MSTDPSATERPTTGRLLVATPPLEDPNFDRTVVYMLDHRDTGAVGVVLNHPTDEPDVDGLEEWSTWMSPPAVVFSGGPVETDALIGLSIGVGHVEGGWGELIRGIGTVDLGMSPDEVAASFSHLRIYRGYAGWGPGQLDAEIDMGAWMVFDARSEDVFTGEPSELWRAVLRRQGGRTAWIANAPDDLSAN